MATAVSIALKRQIIAPHRISLIVNNIVSRKPDLWSFIRVSLKFYHLQSDITVSQVPNGNPVFCKRLNSISGW